MNRKIWIAPLLAGSLMVVGCSHYDGTAEDKQRDKAQSQKAQGDTLGTKALEEKRKREENPNAIGYVYLLGMNGRPFAYYVVKGKVTSSGAQRTPEQDLHWTCRHGKCESQVLDGKMDDGTYGEKDPGIFFTTVEGNHVSLPSAVWWMHTTEPVTLDVPRLQAQKES